MTAPRFDVAVAGLGPAGRALASRCAARGLSVLAIDPRPEATWTPTYGVWADELGDLPATVVRSRVRNPEIRALGEYRLHRDYLVLDNAALQAALPLAGVEIRQARLSDRDVAALRADARVVLDARGARPEGLVPDDPAPAQTAFGIVLPADAAAPALQGAGALLMDWRTDWSSEPLPPPSRRPHRTSLPTPPTFLYAIPVGPDEVLLEETCLAAAPGLPIPELKERLRRRLVARGVRAHAIDHPLDREVVRIPMRGRGRRPIPGTLAVGTAGRGGNLVTGYSVAHSLARSTTLADALARTIPSGRAPRVADPLTPADALREMGLRALLRLDTAGTLALFDAFGRLPAAGQRDFMSRDSHALGLAGAMWGMFARMAPAARLQLIEATLGPSAGHRPAGR